jgi:putative transposase
MKSVGQRYVSYINKLEKRSGTLWGGRYKASLVENGNYILNCMRYIETAPVRLNIVASPIKYKWSSYSVNAQGDEVAVLITPHNSYREVVSWSVKSDKDIQQVYKQLVREELDEQKLKTNQQATNRCLIIGSDEFKASIKKLGSDPK